MESFALGVAALVWWTWPAIAVTVFASLYAAFRIEDRREMRQHARSGPHPCVVHLGTAVDGTEWWCLLREGHSGVHLNQWRVDVDECSTDYHEYP